MPNSPFMEPTLVWAIIALVLVIAELLSGTFYLLMLAVGAFGAAAAAHFGQPFPMQSVVAALLGVAGCYGVHVYRANSSTKRMAPLDAGMPASFESWLDAGARLARVRYRGASWDARVEGNEAIEPGTTLFVLSADGNTLKVAKNRAA
jgi:membrane protein implicated in regulation of membrane protease activity